jgi:hypothetical protein
LFGKLVAWLKVAAVGHDMGDFEPPDGFNRAPYQPDNDVNREPFFAK